MLDLRALLAMALAIILSFTHFVAYRHGKASVRAAWDVEKAQSIIEARRFEQQRQRAVDAAVTAHAGRTRALLAAAGHLRTELDGVRGDLAAVRLHASQSADAAAATITALSDVFEQCTRRYSEVAQAADGHASDSLTLQQAWPK